MANKDAPTLLKPLLQLEDLAGMGWTGGYGALSDATGFGADLFGFDDLAQDLYDVADKNYEKAGQFYEDLTNTYDMDDVRAVLPKTSLGTVLPKTSPSTVLPKTPLETVLPSVFKSTQRMLGQPDPVTTVDDSYLSTPIPADLEPNIGFMGEGDIASDEINALIEAAKGARARSGPKDRGALGRQYRDEKAAAQARADQAIDKKMDADAAAPTAEQMFKAGMDDFLAGIRGAGPNVPKERSLEDYKKEFADATGLDISGDVDKSQALMAFGLALMQNKAKGKGIGGMLDALGSAGTAAMPALSEARKEARANAAAAGKYALEMRSADQAKREAAAEKSLQRQAYYVLPRAKSTAEHVANIIDGAGSREFMNAYELNAAVTSPEFSRDYDIIPASQYDAVVAEAMKSPEVDLGDEWDSSIKQVSLIGGKAEDVPPELQVAAFAANPNYKGKTRTNYRLGESKEGVERRFISMQNDLNNDAERLGLVLKALDDGITIPEQIISSAVQLGRSFGLDMGGVSSVAEAKRQLKNIAIDEVKRILNESGRTISDGERKRTEQRVGEIDWANADASLVRSQVKDIYNLVVTKGQRNLDSAIASFEENFGVPLAVQGNAPKLPTKAELQQLNDRRVAAGKEPLTMDDFK